MTPPELWRRQRADRTTQSSWRRDPLEDQLPGAGRVVGIGLVFCVVAAAVYWPNAADGLLRLLLVALAIGYIGRRGIEAMPPLVDERDSPFGREPLKAQHMTPPQPLYDLLRLFPHQEGAPARSDASAIPPQICRILREEAAQRVFEGHRLDWEDASHHPAIHAVIREPTRQLLDAAGGGRPAPRHIPLRDLHAILDDLEQL